MITLTGKTVCSGIAFGTLYIYSPTESRIILRHVDDVNAELKRFEQAKCQAHDELESLYKKALAEVGKDNAIIFKIHQIMIDDEDYLESIKNIIADQSLNAETAVAQTCDTFSGIFSELEDSYMKERSADIKDVSERIIRILSGKAPVSVCTDEPVIIAANDLSPSETVQFDKSSILAFVMENGSPNSHTSILARNMHIPAVINTADILNSSYNGKYAIVDGYAGNIYIEPDDETLNRMHEIAEELKCRELALHKLKGHDSITIDGKKVGLYANIESVSDIRDVLSNDAEGIGLFRSEYMFLEASSYPNEEVQFSVYKDVLSKMPDKEVTIRTLDLGTDDKTSYMTMPHEGNPAMGIRAIRLCFKNPEIFKTQLRALYRASVFGKLSIMFPMITSEWEIIKINEMINEVKSELDSENIPYSKDVRIGCMIETPAAAIMSDVLAEYVDFFSIGTNDLTQYILAADRENHDVEIFCDTHNRAVIRFINMITRNAHAHNTKVCICGDSAADLDLTETFLALDIDALSVAPEAILPLKQKIVNTDISLTKGEIIKNL